MDMQKQRRRLAALIACVGASSSAVAQFQGFGPRVDIPLSAERPTDVAAADLDSDGDTDLAFCFQGTTAGFDVVGVILNNGDGTFGAPAFYSIGDAPRAISVADVDLDGDRDLVIANTGTNDISVLRNTGTGTFLPEVFFGVGSEPVDVAVGDVNADGRADIVCVNAGDDSVSVVLGDGSGTSWTVSTTLTTNNNGGTGGDRPSSIALGDLNANGLLDIVTTNAFSDTCTVLYAVPGNPGSFFSGDFAVFVAAGDNPQDVQIADIDLDGDMDLLTADRSDNTVSIRVSNRSQTGATFPSFANAGSVGVGVGPVAITLADLDDPASALDGDLDLLVACELSDELVVVLNDGSGGLSVEKSLATLDSPSAAAAADLDGDGDPDVATPSLTGDAVSLFFNLSTTIGGPPPVVDILSPSEGSCLCEGPNQITGTVNPATGTVLGSWALAYRRLGDPSYTTIATGNTGVINDILGVWDTTGLAEGQYLLRLTGSNSGGISATDEAVIRLGNDFDTVSAVLAAGIDGNPVSLVGRRACIFGSISDASCGGVSYTVEYRPASGGAFQPVDPANPVFTGGRTNTVLAEWDTVALGVPDGDYEIRVRGTNACGDTRTMVFDASVDNTAPMASIDMPLDCEYRSPGELIEIRGTASDANLGGWSVQYTGGGSGGWTTIASGNTSVTDDILAVWDTSGLEACAYTIRLTVGDQSVLNCVSPGNSAGQLVSFDLRCEADLTGDNVLNFFDVSAFLQAFNAGCP